MCPFPENRDSLPPALLAWTLPRVLAPATLGVEMPAAALRAQDPMGSMDGHGTSDKSPHCQKAEPPAQS